MAFSINEVEFLAEHQGAIAAATASLKLSKDSMVADMDRLRKQFGGESRAVAELVSARRAGLRTHKLTNRPDDWLVDNDSIQQATAQPVANFRAKTLAAQGINLVHDITCSIGCEGAALTEEGIRYIGSDIDQARVRMAAHNVPQGSFLRADALTETSTADVILADPARRAGGRRIINPQDLLPPLPSLISAHPDKSLVIKCAPGLDFSQWGGGVTLTSLDGGVKEACLLSPSLSTKRRAVLLSTKGNKPDVIEEYDGDRNQLPQAGKISEYIIDPDGAIVRAGLVKNYAAREGLWQIDDRIAYLTGPRIPTGRSGFRFIEEVPLKKLKSALNAEDCGRLEILVRGVDIDPDILRKKLKLRGSKDFAVVITRIGKRGVALVCSARQWA